MDRLLIVLSELWIGVSPVDTTPVKEKHGVCRLECRWEKLDREFQSDSVEPLSHSYHLCRICNRRLDCRVKHDQFCAVFE